MKIKMSVADFLSTIEKRGFNMLDDDVFDRVKACMPEDASKMVWKNTEAVHMFATILRLREYRDTLLMIDNKRNEIEVYGDEIKFLSSPYWGATLEGHLKDVESGNVPVKKSELLQENSTPIKRPGKKKSAPTQKRYKPGEPRPAVFNKDGSLRIPPGPRGRTPLTFIDDQGRIWNEEGKIIAEIEMEPINTPVPTNSSSNLYG